ncbi:MAG TPA: VWA domain-containing protein [Ktedonobacteraceae bacterium]|nr:VWA domain-containing protein [Ktedonobacteraceae bacterium]
MMSSEVALLHQLGRDVMPVIDRSQVVYVLMEARPTELVAHVRMPLNFALVLDCSGSMHGKKLRSVKDAVKVVIDQLSPIDAIAVVTFSNRAQTILPSQPAKDPQGMKARVETIRAGGGTNMPSGMQQGLDELFRWEGTNAIKRMILLTDGRTSGSNTCRQLARKAREAGVVISALGIGADWDEKLLDEIGVLSGGSEAEFVRHPDDAITLFQQQVHSAVDVVVRNAVLTVQLPQGVSPRRAVKVLPTISDLGASVLSDRRVVMPLGDLEKSHPPSILLELVVEPRSAGLFRIAQSDVSYDVPVLGLRDQRVRDDITVTFRSDAMQIAEANAAVMNFVEKVNAFRLVSKVLDEYRQTGKTTTRLAPNVTRVLDAETQAALEQIQLGQQISQEQMKSIGNKTRKLTQRLDNVL